MSALMHILGGAAQGIGGGLVLEGQQRAREAEAETSRRHEIALENLRNQNQRGNMELNANLTDRNAERSDQRGDYYNARQTTRQTASQIAVDANRSTLREGEAQNDFTRQVSLAELNARLNNESAEVQARVRAQYADGDTVQSVDGEYIILKPDGRRIRTGIRGAVPGATGIGAGSILQQAGGAGAAGGAAAGPVLTWNPRTGQFE